MNRLNVDAYSRRTGKRRVQKLAAEELAAVRLNFQAMNLKSLVSKMDTKSDNQFSSNLFSLQLQLKTLLEDAGGDHALELLDALCKLNRSEQNIVIQMLTTTVQKLIQNDVRFSREQDRILNEFEDSLYQDIVNEMQDASAIESQNLPFQRRPVTGTEARLEILKGGRKFANTETDPGLIDFSQALQKRRNRSTTRQTLN